MKYSRAWLIREIETGNNPEFVFFWGKEDKKADPNGKYFLSQFYPSPFTFNNVTYKTAEHWMMAQKALLFEDHNSYKKILLAETPQAAKLMGREIKNFDDAVWTPKRYLIVLEGNLHKFRNNPKLAEFLLSSNRKVIAEANPTDCIWGIGLPKDNINIHNVNTWRGMNLLGFALMEVRDFISQKR